MEKITFKGVRVYRPAAYNREKRIKNKIRLILSPALYKSFSAVLDREYGRLTRIGGYDPKRTDYMPVKRMADGNWQLSVRSTRENKQFDDAEVDAMGEAGRIDCIVYLNAYANDCNQGVRCRLMDYRLTEVMLDGL